MKILPQGLAERLIDLAASIAPASRQEWIAAMRAELGPAGGARLPWAAGCVWTALHERSVDGRWDFAQAVALKAAAVFCLVISVWFNAHALVAGLLNAVHPAGSIPANIAHSPPRTPFMLAAMQVQRVAVVLLLAGLVLVLTPLLSRRARLLGLIALAAGVCLTLSWSLASGAHATMVAKAPMGLERL